MMSIQLVFDLLLKHVLIVYCLLLIRNLYNYKSYVMDKKSLFKSVLNKMTTFHNFASEDLNALKEPYLPYTSDKYNEMLGLASSVLSYYNKASGHDYKLLKFTKLQLEIEKDLNIVIIYPPYRKTSAPLGQTCPTI